MLDHVGHAGRVPQQVAQRDLIAVGQLVGDLRQPLRQRIVEGQHAVLGKLDDHRRGEHLGDAANPERAFGRHRGVVREVRGTTCPLEPILRRVDPDDHAGRESARGQAVHLGLDFRLDIRRERLGLSLGGGGPHGQERQDQREAQTQKWTARHGLPICGLSLREPDTTRSPNSARGAAGGSSITTTVLITEAEVDEARSRTATFRAPGR